MYASYRMIRCLRKHCKVFLAGLSRMISSHLLFQGSSLNYNFILVKDLPSPYVLVLNMITVDFV